MKHQHERRRTIDATNNDILGAATTAEPATPGCYGLAPAGYRLPEATRLGQVRLPRGTRADRMLNIFLGYVADGGTHHARLGHRWLTPDTR